MAENIITIRLCDEDRARLDKLTAALDRRACDSCVATALQIMKDGTPDPVQTALAETLAKAEDPAGAPKTAPAAEETETPTTAPEVKEEPAEAKDAGDAPPVTLEQIQQKVVQLAAYYNPSPKDPENVEQAKKVKKDRLRQIVQSRAKKVTELPAESWTAVWAELVALESEG